MAISSIYSGVDQLGIVGSTAPGIFPSRAGAGGSSTRIPQARLATGCSPSRGETAICTPGCSRCGRVTSMAGAWLGLDGLCCLVDEVLLDDQEALGDDGDLRWDLGGRMLRKRPKLVRPSVLEGFQKILCWRECHGVTVSDWEDLRGARRETGGGESG